MTYNPTNWKRGDVVTSEKLNNIENGISSIPANVTFLNIEFASGENNSFTVVHTDFDADEVFQKIFDYNSGEKTENFPSFVVVATNPTLGYSFMCPLTFEDNVEYHNFTLTGYDYTMSVMKTGSKVTISRTTWTAQLQWLYSAEHATVGVYRYIDSADVAPYSE